jgi:recombinational DNA repair protein (RecF pathway)
MPHYGPIAIHTPSKPNQAQRVALHNMTSEGTDPEMCCICGEIFKKNEMHPTPKGLMCEECWKKSKYYQAPQPGEDK